MATLTLVLLLIVAVLISAVIDQVIPRVSLPLIQVIMGIVIAIFAGDIIDVNLDPSLFLVLFIAPLLYLEAKESDKALLWKNKVPILSLAIGLVIISTLIIGAVVHSALPVISLAAAFALGAALGPTDAVAVTSLSKQVKIPKRQWGVLKGELLLNDASGIVSFQFALAAATTGAFSLLDASVAFALEFVGGLLFGLIMGYLANWVLRKIRDLGIESNTFHVLFEICIPFVVYLFADAIHVSGIIAVVVAGLVNVIAPRTASPKIAHMNIVSSNVWQVISFTLNGLVFVLLGTQIPSAMYYTWQNPYIDNFTLIMMILLVTLVLMSVRFIWCLSMELVHTHFISKQKFKKKNLMNALLITLCGSKGTITLSILFTIPYFMSTGQLFASRSLIIFLGCGVIICTLLIANFIVPLVSPKPEHKEDEADIKRNYYRTLNDVLRNVIEELASQINPENNASVRQVIKIYQDRIENTKEELSDTDITDYDKLQIEALRWEEEKATELVEEGIVDHDVGYKFISRIERMESLIKHGGDKHLIRRMIARIRISASSSLQYIMRRFVNPNLVSSKHDQMMNLQMEADTHVIGILRDMVMENDVATEDASKLLLKYEQALAILEGKRASVTTTIKIANESDEIRRLAYQIELEQIQKMYEKNRLTRQEANRMRDNVMLMRMDLEDTL